jgi:hypothetical protein
LTRELPSHLEMGALERAAGQEEGVADGEAEAGSAA